MKSPAIWDSFVYLSSLRDNRGESYPLLNILSIPRTQKLFLSGIEGALTLHDIVSMVERGYTYPVNHLELGKRFPGGQHIATILALFPSLHTLELNFEDDLVFPARLECDQQKSLSGSTSTPDKAPFWSYR